MTLKRIGGRFDQTFGFTAKKLIFHQLHINQGKNDDASCICVYICLALQIFISALGFKYGVGRAWSGGVSSVGMVCEFWFSSTSLQVIINLNYRCAQVFKILFFFNSSLTQLLFWCGLLCDIF